MCLLAADQDLSIPKPILGKPLAMKILKQSTMANPDTTDIEQSLLTFLHVTHQGEIEKDRQGTTLIIIIIIIFMIQMVVVTVICGSTAIIIYHTRTVLIGIIMMIAIIMMIGIIMMIDIIMMIGIIAIGIIKIIIITTYMIDLTLVIIEGIIMKIIGHHKGKTEKIEFSEINSPGTVMHHTLKMGGHFRILLVVKKKAHLMELLLLIDRFTFTPYECI